MAPVINALSLVWSGTGFVLLVLSGVSSDFDLIWLTDFIFFNLLILVSGIVTVWPIGWLGIPAFCCARFVGFARDPT